MNIVLTGFMCTGKTSVGLKLAEKLNYNYIDTDELIEIKEGLKISEIFEKFGEKYFREVEKDVIKEVSSKDRCVISTGGGVVINKENIFNLRKNGIIINLTASPQTIFERLKKQPGIRPLLNKPDPLNEIKNLLNKREEYYKDCDLRIQTDNLTVEEVVNIILEKIKNKI